jgi:O-antigen/teichoic acid export membrane protein
MSISKNIVAGFLSQIYVAAISIVILPLYLKYMGAEAYGLIGFFTMLQVWFNLLDLGLTPTVARETARCNSGSSSVLEYRQFVRVLTLIFWILAFVFGGLLFTLSGIITSRWLDLQRLSHEEVRLAVQLMSVTTALRWVAGIYRGCISGAERIVWLSGFNALIATLRFAGALVIFEWIGASLEVFFTYQLLVALVELLGLLHKAGRLLPNLPGDDPAPLLSHTILAVLRPKMKFSLNMGFLTLVWILVTQVDKLALSTLLPLDQYGYFSLAVLLAGGILLINAPIGNALMPRMAMLHAKGEDAQLINLYKNATKATAAIVVPASLLMGLFPEKLTWVLTGDPHTASQAAPVLSLYAMGNGVLALAAFPYYLQYAKGDLRLHLISNVFFLIVLVPAIFWSTLRYGATGAGYAWLTVNLINLLFWTPKIHRRLAKNKIRNWLFPDVIEPSKYAFTIIPLFYILSNITSIWPTDRIGTFAVFSSIYILIFFLSTLDPKNPQSMIYSWIDNWRKF